MHSIGKYLLLMLLLAFTGSALAHSDAGVTEKSCEKPDSAWLLLDALKNAANSTDEYELVCLFQFKSVDIEFDKKWWFGPYKQFSKEYPDLLKSGFSEFMTNADRKNTKIDARENTLLIDNRLKIFFQNGGSSAGYFVYKIRDIKYPNRFIDAAIYSEAEFTSWFKRFQAAATNDDKESVASMVCYPLKVEFWPSNLEGRHENIASSQDFVLKYGEIVTPHLIDVVRNAPWPNLIRNSRGYILGQGDVSIVSTGMSECISNIVIGPGIENLDREAAANRKG